tara:strand:+ start:76 stop:219 length:144 start_codon:yes stop_codon:yes gene_type:complete
LFTITKTQQNPFKLDENLKIVNLDTSVGGQILKQLIDGLKNEGKALH